MPNFSHSTRSRIAVSAGLIAAALISACGGGGARSSSNTALLNAIPAIRLNYKYEPDVPAPTLPTTAQEEKVPAVQADFDANRPQESLDRTLTSPDKKHVFAVYRRVTDRESEFRIDSYSIDGKLLKKVTSDAMAVHFPDTIVWAPDSSSIAFVAMTRAAAPATPGPAVNANTSNTNTAQPADPAPADANAEPAANTETTASPAAAPTPAAPTGILTFRNEQIYLCNAGGEGLRPITQTDGLIYFYYVWSPDSSMLAALAVSSREWEFYDGTAAMKGESWTPVGRLRVVEKNGRERRLDDNLTAVHPVFSPDSTKVAVAYDTQIRIYDAAGLTPTQAGIPLKNQLLLSSQAYDQDQMRKQQGQDQAANTEGSTATAANSDGGNQPPTTLPDEKSLASFNPIVEVEWTADDLLYFQTAYVKRLKSDANNVTSYVRWHRLILSGQPTAANKPQ